MSPLYGGRLDQLSVANWNQEFVFASAYSSGIWRVSLEDGEWEEMNTGFPLESELEPFYELCQALYSSPHHEGLVLASTFGQGIYRTIDYGESWHPLVAPLPFGSTEIIAVDPDDVNRYFVADYYANQVKVSIDGGEHWEVVENVPAGAILFDPANSNHLFIGARESQDGGESWDELPLPDDLEMGTIRWLVPNPESTTSLYVVWKQGTLPLYRLYSYSTDTQTWDFLTLVDSPASCHVAEDGTLLVRDAVTETLQTSTDGGDSWSTLPWSEHPEDLDSPGTLLDVVFLPGNPVSLLVTTTSGPFISTGDFTSLADFRSELPLFSARAISVSGIDNNRVIYVGGDSGLLRSTDNGTSWTRLLSLAVTSVSSSPNGRVYLRLFNHPHLYYSLDSGESFTASTDSPYLAASSRPADFVIHSQSPGTVWYLAQGVDSSAVFRSENHGQSWTLQKSTSAYVSDLVQPPDQPDALYLSGWGLERSMDGGDNWESLDTPSSDIPYSSALINFNGTGGFFLSNGVNYIAQPSFGEPWESYTDGLPGQSSYPKPVEINHRLVTLAQSNELWKRDPADETWSFLTTLPTLARSYSPPVNADDGLLLFFSFKSGLCFYDLNDMGIPDLAQPESSELAKAYPNPFNSTLMIQLPSSPPDFTIRVLNVLGREVARIPQQPMLGTCIQWTPGNLASGRYMIQISNRNESYYLPITYIR